jgi:hypothetical protein
MYGDTAVQLYVTLSDGGMPYAIGKSCWAQFVAKKPDNSEPLLRKCVIENGTVIRLDFDDGIADVAGVYDCEIRLYGAEGKITSPCFTMVVDPRVAADYIGDDAENNFIDQIGTTMAEFQRAEEARETAEAERVAAEEERVAKFGELQLDLSDLNAKTSESIKGITYDWDTSTFSVVRHDGNTYPIDHPDLARGEDLWDEALNRANADYDIKAALQAEIDKQERRISNLEEHISDDYFATDETVAYEKAVPARACSSAKLLSVGGMTYKCNNIAPFPYFDGKDIGYSTTIYGVTFTVNDDRSITVNGTATGTIVFSVCRLSLPAGTYTLTPSAVALHARYLNKGYNEWVKNLDPTFTVTAEDAELYNVDIQIYVYTGTTINNAKVHLMLSEGTTALPYEPYYEGLRDSKVTEIKNKGVNRFNFKQMHNGNSQSTVIFNIVDNNTFKLISTKDYSKDMWYYRGTIIPIESDVSQIYVKFNAKTFGEVTRGIVNIRLKNASDIQLAAFDALGTGEVSETFNISGYLNGSKGYLDVSIYCSGGEACTTGAGVEYSKVIISLDADVPYVPYREPISYPIPAEIQAIEGYGKDGFNIDLVAQESDYNGEKKPLPVPFGSIIKVEGGGSLEFVNEYKNPVPSAVKYLLKEESAV